MKNYMLSFVLLGFCLVWACRPKEIIPPIVITNNPYANTHLKSITVEGSSEISINRELGIIQITLPESYSSKSVVVNFDLGVNALLYYNWSADQPRYDPNNTTPEKQSIKFNYQGITPVDVSILYGETRDDYKIYVNHVNKKFTATINFSDSVRYDFNYFYSLVPTSFQGTYPNIPFLPKSSFLLLKSNTTNLIDTTFLNHTFWNGSGPFNLRKFYPFDNQVFSVELINNGERILLKENFQIFSETPIVQNSYGNTKVGSGFELKGGIFLPSKKYSIILFNDYLNAPIALNAKVKNANTLFVESSQSILPNGYIIEVFEDSKSISKTLFNVSNSDKLSTILAFRRGEENYSNVSGTNPSVQKIQLNQEETFSILPVDAFISCYGIKISQEQLDKIETPFLQLSKGSNEIKVLPKKIIVWWLVATCNVVYFQYTIPKSVESGFYEAQLVYPDGRESLKYWNKVEIK